MNVKKNLSMRFNMKGLGKLSWFLGLEFYHESGAIKISQSKFIEKVLTKFCMESCKPRSTPCEISCGQSDDVLEDDEATVGGIEVLL